MYTVYLNGLIKNIVVIESIHKYIECIKMFQCFKLPSCLLKYLVGSRKFTKNECRFTETAQFI